ncbi:hypothetical protein Bca4012_020976 [Brassica carinata]
MTLVLGAEVGVDVDAEFFEAISQMNMITDETFSVSIKACCGLLVGTVRPKPMVGSGNISSCVLAYPPCVILLQSLGLNGIRSLGSVAAPVEKVGDSPGLVSSSDPCNPELAEALTPMISPRVPIILTTMKDVGEVGVDDMWNPAVRGRGKRGKCPLLMRTLFLFWHRLRSVLGFHSFCPSSSLMPSPEDLIFSQSYAEWASFEAQARGNLVIDQYDRRCRWLSDELESERHALMGEREIVGSFLVFEGLGGVIGKVGVRQSRFDAEVNHLKEEVMEWGRREEALPAQKSILEAEVSRLVKPRQELVDLDKERVESIISTPFSAFVEKVRAYLSDRDLGILIPAEKLAENKRALSVLTAALDETEVHELNIGDLPSFSSDVDKEMAE